MVVTSDPEPAGSSASDSGKMTLLLLEDASGDVQLFTTFVRGNVDIVCARDGAEALDCLFRRGRFRNTRPPDIFVLDLNVPLLNGHEVLNACKSNSQTRGIPVVVWSGSDNPDDIRKAYDLGCCGYMVKSPHLERVESQLTAFSDFWLKSVRYASLNH